MSSLSHSDIRQLHLECETARESGGAIRLEDTVIMHLGGSDSLDWFNRFCTNDLLKLSPGEGCEALVLNVKGKTLAHVLVMVESSDAVTLVCLGRPQSAIQDHLERYIIREDVTLADGSEEWNCLYVRGDLSPSQMTLPSAGRYAHVMSNSSTRIVRTAITCEQDWLLLANQEATPALRSELDRLGFAAMDRDCFDSLRVDYGMPWNGLDVTEANLPQEIQRDQSAISLTKGCYLGQETVARIDAMGHVNQFLVRLAAADLVDDDAVDIHHGETKVGRVTSSAISPVESKAIFLGYVRRKHAAPGTQLSKASGQPITVLP